MKFRALVIPIAVLLTLVLSTTAVYAALTSKDIEKELMCQCGCTMVVDVCECETANQMRVRIAELIDQGQDKDQIIASFVSQYGEKILASPPKKGFNLVAWIVPFAAVAAGGIALFFILRVWATKGKTLKVSKGLSPVPPASSADTDGYRDQLDAELKKLREEDNE